MNLDTGAIPSSSRAYRQAGRKPHADAFRYMGMPISYIIDRAGRLSGYITGEVEWTSQQGRAFLEYHAHG